MAMNIIDVVKAPRKLSGLRRLRSAVFAAAAVGQLAALFPSSIAFTNSPRQFTPLVAGSTFDREIVGDEKHIYSLSAAAGEFVHVSVRQGGAGLVVRLAEPDGEIIDVADEKDWSDKQHVYLVSEAATTANLEVSEARKDGPRRRYVLTVEAWRAAVQPDRDRVAARRLHRDGLRLEQQGSEDSRRQAIARIREAQKLYVGIDDRIDAVNMLHDIATIHVRLGQAKEAIDVLNEALPLCREAGSLRCETVTYNYIGTCYQEYAGDYRKALEAHLQSLESVRNEHDRRREAIARNNVAAAHSLMGEYQDALEFYQQSLALRRETGDRRGEASTLNNIGGTFRDLGEYQKALEYYDLSLAVGRELKDRNHEARMLNNIGTVYLDLRNYPKAIEYFDQALALRREIKERRGEATTLNNIGQVYGRLGEYQKALEYFKQAMALRREVKDRRGELQTMIELGRTLTDLNDYPNALDYLTQALPVSRAMGARADEARTLYSLAVVEKKRGDLPAAQDHIKAAIEVVESIRGRVAGLEQRASFLATKEDYFQFYIDLLMEIPGGEGAALTINERARARTLEDLLVESRIDIREGADQTLLAREREVQSQLNAKSARYNQLADNQNSARMAAALKSEIASLVDEYQLVEAQVRARSPRYAALTQPQTLTVEEIQHQVLDGQTLLLEYRLGRERSYLWAVSADGCRGYVLPKGQDIESLARRLYELIIERPGAARTRGSAGAGAASASGAISLDQTAAELSRMLLAPVAAQLGRKRLLIAADGALQYVPFAVLPVPEVKADKSARGQAAALRHAAGSHTLGHPLLIADHEIVSVPSASVLAVLRRDAAGRKRAPKTLAVLADPVFGNDDVRASASHPANEIVATAARTQGDRAPAAELQRSQRESGLNEFVRLRFSREEAEGIASLAPEEVRLEALDFAASRATAMSAGIGQYRILHFATHGLLNSQHPELSGLVFSLIDEQGRSQDGFLRLNEVYNLKLNADLVVLSACQTALGKEVKGEGLIGLTRGFMYAGAPRVAASLWRVDDRATAELMKRFYKGMLKDGLAPAAALRGAQLSLQKEARWSAPYYWAAFALQGEWR